MTLDRLSQITEVGIKSGITLRNINVEGAYVSGVVTATTLNADNYIGNATGRLNPSALNVTGVTTFQGNVFHGDGDIAYFGDGNDLLIFHNSTDSIIRDNGTGDLFIEGGNRIRLTNPTGIETYAVFNQDGASELYFDNVKRFETTNAGVTVTGNLTASSATITGNVSVAGTVTYEDVTNVDSIGVVTARSGVHVTSGNLGVGTNAPVTSIDASQETDAIALPQGTTAQRPTGNNPYIRYNTTNSALEFYNGTDWVEIISDYFPTGSTILG